MADQEEKFQEMEFEVAEHRLKIDYLGERVDELEERDQSTWRSISDLNSSVKLLNKIEANLEKTVDNLTSTTTALQVALTASSARMNIVIAILSVIGIAFVGICIKVLVGV